MPRRLGGFGACKCCRCTDCCSGLWTYDWYVNVVGATDSACSWCNESLDGNWYITSVGEGGGGGDGSGCWWQGYFGDTAYWVYSDSCIGTVEVGGFTFAWRVWNVFPQFDLTISCLDDESYEVNLTIELLWAADGDPVDCGAGYGVIGQRRSKWNYYAVIPIGGGECAAWSAKTLSLTDVSYEYWDTTADPLNPFWTPMTPTTYTPCVLPSTVTITSGEA
jgi:hypothetical protein